MKKSGEICKVDNLGRIVIPVRIRRQFDFTPGSTLEIFLEEDGFFVKKYIPVCVFCGKEENLVEKNGKCICKNCIEDLQNQ